MNCFTSIEKFENDITILSAIPLIGTIPSLCKALFGLAQLISALALYLFSTIASVDDAFPDLALHAIEHIGHGATNFFWGCAMAIPLLGTFLFIVKLEQARKREEVEATPYVRMKYGSISPSPKKAKRPSTEQSPLTKLSFSLLLLLPDLKF